MLHVALVGCYRVF